MLKFLKKNIADISILFGCTLVSIGTFIISIAAGFITSGLLVFGIAFLLHKKGSE